MFQSRQNHVIEPLSQVNSVALPYHISGHYVNYNKDVSSFRPSPTVDPIEDFSVNALLQQSIRATTTVTPLTKFLPDLKAANTQTTSNIRTNFTYFTSPLHVDSKTKVNYFQNLGPNKHPLQVLYMPLKPNHLKSQYTKYPSIISGFKRPFLKPITQKLHPTSMYNIQPELKLNPNFKTPQHKTQILISTSNVFSPLQTQFTPETLPATDIKNVEISPKQASTEREPEIQTASPLISIHPASNENFNFKTPLNTGFNPGSVIIEGGFKPVINKGIENRMDEPELNLESQSGVIDVKGKKFEKYHQKETFLSVIIPSTNDKMPKQKHRKNYKRPIQKDILEIMVRPRSMVDSDVELEMAAADRVDTFYLPPPGKIDKPKTSAAKQPSEIDFETPSISNLPSITGPSLSDAPDTVVTYDGKKVSGASLTAKPFDKSTILQHRGSKAAELIKAFPQSVPFRGDLPPLNANVLFNVKSRQPNTHQGVLSRNLDTPLPPPSGSTKLKRVRRAAHHTPEHTAEQMRQMNQIKNNSTTSGSKSLMQFTFVCLTFSVALIKTFIG